MHHWYHDKIKIDVPSCSQRNDTIEIPISTTNRTIVEFHNGHYPHRCSWQFVHNDKSKTNNDEDYYKNDETFEMWATCADCFWASGLREFNSSGHLLSYTFNNNTMTIENYQVLIGPAASKITLNTIFSLNFYDVLSNKWVESNGNLVYMIVWPLNDKDSSFYQKSQRRIKYWATLVHNEESLWQDRFLNFRYIGYLI